MSKASQFGMGVGLCILHSACMCVNLGEIFVKQLSPQQLYCDECIYLGISPERKRLNTQSLFGSLLVQQ